MDENIAVRELNKNQIKKGKLTSSFDLMQWCEVSGVLTL